MSEITLLKVLFTERLAAVAVEIFDAVEKTFVKYQEEVNRSYEEKYRLLQLYFVAHPDRENDSTLDLQQHNIPVSEEDEQHQPGLRQACELTPGETFCARVKEEEVEASDADVDDFIKVILPCVSSDFDRGTPALPQGLQSQAVTNKDGRSPTAAATDRIKTQSCGAPHETAEPASRPQAFCVVSVDCSGAESFEGERSGGLPAAESNPVKSKKTAGKKAQRADSEETSKCKVAVETVSGERRPHRCQECGKRFGQSADLVAHTRQHRGEKPYECLECGKGFSTKVGQALHVRRHTGEKPYQCKECGKSFVHNRYLSLHMRTHTGEKLYSCQQCGKCLNHKCRLIDHMRRHKGEKPFKCQECDKCFYRRGELAVHMRIHSGERPYECSVCGKHFSLHQYLTRHLRIHTVNNQEKVNVKRKGMKYNLWREERMAGAVTEYKGLEEAGEEPSLRCVAKTWSVPKSTLQRRLKGRSKGSPSSHSSGRAPLMPEEAEAELAGLLTALSQRGFPLRKTDVQCIAYEFAKVNNILGFSRAKQKAGYYWFRGFMRRNPALAAIQGPGPACVAAGTNSEVAGKWFRDYRALLERLRITDVPSHIWSCDWSALQDDSASGRIVGDAGKPCLEIATGETGGTAPTTVLASFNAAGVYAPPMVVFEGASAWSEWLRDSPENVSVGASENGRMNAGLFVDWGKGFVRRLPTDAAAAGPHLLLLDAHCGRAFSLEFLDLMKAHDVHVMCCPPRVGLRAVQPTLCERLKHNWREAGRGWDRPTAGTDSPPDMRWFFSVFSEAWKKTATVENAQAGFRASGTFPVNCDVIRADVFAPGATMEKAQQTQAQEQCVQ